MFRCSHCRKLAIVLDSVAHSLKTHPNIYIAKFDVTKVNNSIIAHQYDIRAYPTLLYFKHGIYYGKYEGPRNKETLEKFMISLLYQEEYFILSNDFSLLQQKLKEFDYAFVLSLPSKMISDTQLIKEVELAGTSTTNSNSYNNNLLQKNLVMFRKMSKKWYLKATFIVYSGDEVNEIAFSRMEANKQPYVYIVPSPLIDLNNSSIVNIQDKSSLPSSSSSSVSIPPPQQQLLTSNDQHLDNFISNNNHPFFVEIDSHNSKVLGHLPKTMVLLIFNPILHSSIIEDFESACYLWYVNADANSSDKSTASKFHQSLLFGFINGVKFKRYFASHGVISNTNDMPSIILLNNTHDLYFTVPLDTLLLKEQLSQSQQSQEQQSQSSSGGRRSSSNIDVPELSVAVGNLLSAYQRTVTAATTGATAGGGGTGDSSSHTDTLSTTHMPLILKPFQRLTFIEKMQNKVRKNYPWSVLIIALPFLLLFFVMLMPQPTDRYKEKKN